MTNNKKGNEMKEIVEKLVEGITNYGYNSEYGYYSDWADGVRPIVEKGLSQALSSQLKEVLKAIESKYREPGSSYENEGYNQALDDIKAEVEKLR